MCRLYCIILWGFLYFGRFIEYFPSSQPTKVPFHGSWDKPQIPLHNVRYLPVLPSLWPSSLLTCSLPVALHTLPPSHLPPSGSLWILLSHPPLFGCIFPKCLQEAFLHCSVQRLDESPWLLVLTWLWLFSWGDGELCRVGRRGIPGAADFLRPVVSDFCVDFMLWLHLSLLLEFEFPECVSWPLYFWLSILQLKIGL